MTYQYRCKNCGVIEIQQSIKDKPLTECPNCHSSVYRIVAGGIGVIYKTNGFYTTDSRPMGAYPKDSDIDLS